MTTSTITIQAIDINDNPLTTGGSTVTLDASLGTLNTVTDLGNGSYFATLTSPTTSGPALITGRFNGATIVSDCKCQITSQMTTAATEIENSLPRVYC